MRLLLWWSCLPKISCGSPVKSRDNSQMDVFLNYERPDKDITNITRRRVKRDNRLFMSFTNLCLEHLSSRRQTQFSYWVIS